MLEGPSPCASLHASEPKTEQKRRKKARGRDDRERKRNARTDKRMGGRTKYFEYYGGPVCILDMWLWRADELVRSFFSSFSPLHAFSGLPLSVDLCALEVASCRTRVAGKKWEREREKAERLCDAMHVCKRARTRRRRGKKKGRMIFLRCWEREKSRVIGREGKRKRMGD